MRRVRIGDADVSNPTSIELEAATVAELVTFKVSVQNYCIGLQCHIARDEY